MILFGCLLAFVIYVVTTVSALSVQSKLDSIVIMTVGVFLEILITILFYTLDIGG